MRFWCLVVMAVCAALLWGSLAEAHERGGAKSTYSQKFTQKSYGGGLGTAYGSGCSGGFGGQSVIYVMPAQVYQQPQSFQQSTKITSSVQYSQAGIAPAYAAPVPILYAPSGGGYSESSYEKTTVKEGRRGLFRRRAGGGCGG